MSEFRRRLMMAAGEKELPDYLCFTALEDGTFTLTIGSAISTTVLSNISYSLDGSTWVTTNNVNNTEVTITTPTIQVGEKVYWKGNGKGTTDSQFRQSTFSSDGTFNIEGNILSLLFDSAFGSYDTITQNNCFFSLFRGSKVVNADNLIMPLHRSNSCYVRMFQGCTSLVSAKFTLEYDSSRTSPYEYMFTGCSSLTDAPIIKNTIGEAWRGMFYGCTSLVNIEDINITSGTFVHRELFYNCKALTKMPVKYSSGVIIGSMGLYDCFNGCISLVNTNDTLANLTSVASGDNTCNDMFRNCSSLVTPPKIPNISTLSKSVFQNMFNGCTSLTSAPALPWTTLAQSCYNGMFLGCTSLTTAPQLPATVLAQDCYLGMLRSSGVTWIKMLATDISASNCLSNWTWGVGNTSDRVFVKHIDAQWTTTGVSGVPTNWTIIYYDPAVDKYYTDQTRATECDDHGNPL